MKRLLLAAALLSSPLLASYGYVATVTFNNHPSSTLTDFPALVCANGAASTNCDSAAHASLALPDLKTSGNGGKLTSSFGYDAGFFSSSSCSSSLSYQLVPGTYNATTGFAEWYVKLPSLSSSADTVIYLCYSNSSITTDQSTTATWNSNFLGVYHFPDGSSLSVADSTSHAFNGTVIGGVTAGTGQIDGGAVFNGTTGWVSTVMTYPTGAMMASAWVKITSFTNNPMVVRWLNSSQAYFLINTAGRLQCCNGGACSATISVETLSINTWAHVACVITGATTNTRLYLNGVETTYVAQSPGDIVGSTNLAIGSSFGSSTFLPGTMDEVRVAHGDPTGAWIAAEYNNQAAPWTYYTFGAAVSTAVVRRRAVGQW